MSKKKKTVHQFDLFPTLAEIVGGRVPDDRIVDGVDQSAFFLGRQEKSNREGFVVYVGNDVYGVKWRNWKMMTKEIDKGATDPIRTYGFPLFYNLLLDPKEEHPLLYAAENLWVRYPAGQILIDHAKSLRQESPIRPGTPNPYTPPQR